MATRLATPTPSDQRTAQVPGDRQTSAPPNMHGSTDDPSPSATASITPSRDTLPSVNQRSAPVTIARSAIGQMQMMPPRMLRPIKPAPPPPTVIDQPKSTTFFDLPAELRIEIYKLVLDNVIIHVLPLQSQERHCPHALVRTSRQVRNEALPIIHASCEIRAVVTDFNFGGMLAWIDRIPSQAQGYLSKNENLSIRLCTSTTNPNGDEQSLRRWLKMRADRYRAQPNWQYSGPAPNSKMANSMKRKAKRMPEEGKKHEMIKMLNAVSVVLKCECSECQS